MKDSKKLIIAMLCMCVLIMSVTYAAFISRININGTAEITSEWNLQFTSIVASNRTSGVTEVKTPSAIGTTATFHVGLKAPGDEITYVITLSNLGTIPAVVNEITASETGSDAIIFEVIDLSKGDKIGAKSSKDFKVKISFDSSVTSQPNISDSTLQITINCVQDLGQTITPGDLEINTTRLSAKILKDNIVQSDENINFGLTSEESGTNGLYYTNKNTQNNGTTYYFRGNVDNNYVKFGERDTCTYNGENVGYVAFDGSTPYLYEVATQSQCESTKVCDAGTKIKDNYGMDYRYVVGVEPTICSAMGGTPIEQDAIYESAGVSMYWRIVRVNGDGSIRLIHTATISNSSYNNNLGYIDSVIKNKVDEWYGLYLEEYGIYISDSIFCNDNSW